VWKGERVGDTELIIERLTRELRVDPDAHLTPFQRATGLAIRRMFEEHFNFSHMHDLFITEEGWRHMRPHFDFLPAPVRPFLAPYIRSAVRKEVYAQGLGRHERAEIDAMAAADLDAAAALLGDQPFFLGDQATLTDCSAFGFLGMTLWWPVRSASREHLASQPGLVGFCERMRDRLWPELSY
jgi:glutathione S-transferase